MSDRFDHTLERKLDTKPDGSDEEPRGVRRIELITGVMPKACDARGRRHWPMADRSRILLESLEPGANVSEVARRNGLSPQQLFGWRREARSLIVDDAGATTGTAPSAEAMHVRRRRKGGKAKASGRARPSTGNSPAFAPVVIAAPATATPPSSETRPSGLIEIAIGEVVIRVRGQVDAGVLAAVLKTVRRSS